MGYRRTYHEILEMWRSWALTKKNADSIMRRSGFKPGAEIGDVPPTPILSLPGSKKQPMDAGVLHCGFSGRNLAVTPSGKMYAWGPNDLTLGIAGNPSYTTPTRVHSEIPDAVDFATSQDITICVRANGHVPSNDLVITTTVDDLRWEEIPHVGDVWPPERSVPFTDVVETAAGRASASNEQHFLLRSNGEVWGKGEQMPGLVGSSDAYEELGSGGGSFIFNGDLGDWTRLSPTKIGGSVSSIAWGANRLVFLRDDGVVGSWNYNANPLFPTSTPANIVKIVHSGTAIHVLTDGGEIWSVGSNQFGQLGILDSTNSAALNALTVGLGGAFSQTIGDGYTDIAAGTHWSFGRAFVFAVKDGRLWTWGAGGVISARPADPLITNLRGAPVEITNPDIDDIEMVEGGGGMANGMYVSASNGLYIWGLNNVGSLGQGYLSPTTGSGVPIPLNVAGPSPDWSV